MVVDLRAITVRQPWLEAIVDGYKDTENRAQGFPKRRRGPVLLHAAAAWSRHGLIDERILELYPALRTQAAGMTLGAVNGIAEIVDIHPASGCCEPWGEETYAQANPEDRPPGRVTHIRFESPVRIRPILCPGALGFWRADRDLILEVCHRLAELVTWDRAGARAVAERSDFAQLWSLVRDDAEAKRS